jgi:hypothetical protein
MPLSVYQNNTERKNQNYIQVKLNGLGKNTQAIGAKLLLSYQGENIMVENFNSRGFESSVADKITVGLGDWKRVDTLKIIWPRGRVSTQTNVAVNKLYEINEDENLPINTKKRNINPKVNLKPFSDFVHMEHDVNLFTKERMLIEMNGFDGPALAVADINGDKIEDVFIGGAKNQSSELYISSQKNYIKIIDPFKEEINNEKVRAKFFDSDGDGDKDLYVAHGGKNYSSFSSELNDALYINNGKGEFQKEKDFTQFTKLISTCDISINDINMDGKLDILLAEKYNVDFYGAPVSIAVLTNLGNNKYKFEIPQALQNVGIGITMAVADMNHDRWPDIVFGGKWSPIQIVYNSKGQYKTKPITIEKTHGLWNTIHINDVDGDGDNDIIAGNEGLNSMMAVNHKMYIADFDQNGIAEQIVCANIDGKYYPIHDNEDMYSQIPSLKKNFLYHRDMAKASIEMLFSKEVLSNVKSYEINELRSIVLLNGGKNFTKEALPYELQLSSINAIYTEGKSLYFGGNQYQIKPQFGRLDASKGWYMSSLNDKPISLGIQGQIRTIVRKGKNLLFAINNIGIKELEL